MSRKFNRNTHAMKAMRNPGITGVAWMRLLQQGAAALLFILQIESVHAAVTFPTLPLQTGAAQPAPNVIFILDDSQSMVGAGGEALDTGLTWSNTSPGLGSGSGAPYTKNPLSYNPATTYRPWATSNTTNTALVRLANADYANASDNDAVLGNNINLGSSARTYYVPKPSATDLTDQRQYYRYQILTDDRIIRSEYLTYSAANTPATSTSGTLGSSATGSITAGNTSGPWSFTVPAGVTSLTISSSGGSCSGSNKCADLYERRNGTPSTGTYDNRGNSNGNTENITITNPPAGTYYVNLYAQTAYTGKVTVTYSYTSYSDVSAMGCATSTSGSGWRYCTDVSSSGDASTGVRALAAEKQNYANWYQYHRTRMKVAKAGGSEAFAALDENYRVGVMGLYPSGQYQQTIGVTAGNNGNAAPTAANAGNLNNIIPVDATNGGLFVGDNRKDWFDHLHGMVGKYATPLRKALDGAGKYYSTARAYKSVDSSGNTSYLACRQDFAILTTDGYWNNFGGNDDPDSSYINTAIRGDEEDGSVITGPNGQSYQYLRAAPYWYNITGSDKNDTTTLADIAMHYWKTDLRTANVSGYPGSADNKVPTSVTNPAFWQHMVTFGVGLGVHGQLTDAQIANAVAGTGSSANGGYWPAPVHTTGVEDNPQNVDDLRHAALNSRGSYINANDAEQFSNGIADALNRIGERRGSASNVLANSTSISTDSFVFQATYTSGAWRGELLAYPISGSGLGQPEWRAGEHIRAWNTRNIFTAGATNGSTFPTATQLTALGTPATALGVTDVELANYLKGDASKEKRNGGILRNRTVRRVADDQIISALLGDIVDSSPFYVADNQTLFVGANDGMLHAIDTSNTAANGANTSGGGTERFTYVPRGVAMSQLADLANPLYGTNAATQPHRYFVDGPVVVSARARTPGKNYLVGALGRGGKGVYGLDVTNPGSFSTSNVLWDKTFSSTAPTGYDNMGNVIAEPLISKLNNGVTAAVVANGPNSSSGTASLFIINLDDGSVIKELNTSTANNGLSAPRAVDVDADGLVDIFFAGDLLGNVWRFNVSASSTGSWTVNKVFTAKDASNNAQAISGGLGVARDPSTGTIWLFFGTGRYFTTTDQNDTSTQSFYGVMVGTTGAVGTNLARADLQSRAINVVDATTGRRAFEPYEVGVVSTDKGWVIDLDNPANTGERVITAPILFDNVLVFSSIVPPGAGTVNSCEAGGSGYVNALNAFSGTSLNSPFFAIEADLTDADGNALPIGSLPITTGMPTAPIIIGTLVVVGDSSGGTPTSQQVNPPGGASTRRLSWRELVTD